MIPERTIAHLSLYRRLLDDLLRSDRECVYSYELASLSRNKPAQVRRDLMAVDYAGSSARGYEVDALVESIDRTLDGPGRTGVALVGVGNLGRAVLHFFMGRRKRLEIVAAFDHAPEKVDRVIHGCPVYPIERLGALLAEKGISLGIVTVPASEAQKVADLLALGGVKGILNFAPVPLRVPRGVYVEAVDMTALLEKVAFFARKGQAPERLPIEEEG